MIPCASFGSEPWRDERRERNEDGLQHISVQFDRDLKQQQEKGGLGGGDSLVAGCPTIMRPCPSIIKCLLVTSIVELVVHTASRLSTTEHLSQYASHVHS